MTKTIPELTHALDVVQQHAENPMMVLTPEPEMRSGKDMVPVSHDNSAASILLVIEKMANNRTSSTEKMVALLDMYERLQKMQAEKEFNQAMARLQAVLPFIDKKGRITFTDKNDTVRNTPYAKFEDIEREIRALYIAEGFDTSYDMMNSAEGRIIVILRISHVSGHYRLFHSPALMNDTSGKKNDLQAIGSTMSYGKRYCLTNGFGIVTQGEDDDGKKGGAAKPKADKFANRVDQQAAKPTNTQPDELTARAEQLRSDLKALKTKANREALLSKNLELLRALEAAGKKDAVKVLHAIVDKGGVHGE